MGNLFISMSAVMAVFMMFSLAPIWWVWPVVFFAMGMLTKVVWWFIQREWNRRT